VRGRRSRCRDRAREGTEAPSGPCRSQDGSGPWTATTACCPVPRWAMGATTGQQLYRFGPCDKSLRCPDHAHLKADAVLLAARRDWLGLDVIYFAAVLHDAGLITGCVARADPVARQPSPGTWSGRTGRAGARRRWFTCLPRETCRAPGRVSPHGAGQLCSLKEAIERLAEALWSPGPFIPPRSCTSNLRSSRWVPRRPNRRQRSFERVRR